MKFVFQFSVILAISFLGEVIKSFIPLPIPASIYGLVLMLLSLKLKLIRLEKIEQAGDFLLQIMPLMFIPAAVGLIGSWDALRPILLPVCVITIVTTLIVMGATGVVTQAITRRKDGRDE